MSNNYIAVFDSGVGGISVLRQLQKELPNEKFLYYGDSANAPYGSRSTEEVRTLTLAAVERIQAEFPLKALVVACNTATAAAITALRETYPELIVVGIEPALKVAADHFPGGRVGVMATEVTLREEKFDLLLHRFDENCTVAKIPAPGLVPLIEAGKAQGPEMDALLREILGPYVNKLDALVLGCTHYPLVSPAISRMLGPSVALLDGGNGTARETRRRLAQGNLLCDGPGSLIFRSSGSSEKLKEMARQYLRP